MLNDYEIHEDTAWLLTFDGHAFSTLVDMLAQMEGPDGATGYGVSIAMYDGERFSAYIVKANDNSLVVDVWEDEDGTETHRREIPLWSEDGSYLESVHIF